jgi:hypothetical protein
MSTMAAIAIGPVGVSIGLRPISTGNSVPFLRSANRSRPSPIGRAVGCSP